jgi:hypothetical protein
MPVRMMRIGFQEQPMKLDPAISAKLAGLQPNHVGLLPWSLLAHPLPCRRGVPTSLTPIPRNRRTRRATSMEPSEPTLA